MINNIQLKNYIWVVSYIKKKIIDIINEYNNRLHYKPYKAIKRVYNINYKLPAWFLAKFPCH